MEEGAGAPSGGQRAASNVDPLVGQVFNDKFKIISLLAKGGMGAVYRAEQAPLGRACAIKVLTPNVAEEQRVDFQKRFFREASVASKLTHPNAVTIFDYGRTEDGQFFMAMELLEGKTLLETIRGGGAPLTEDRAVHIGRQICRALREAHSLGVIHRDIKSANVFLVNGGDEEEDFIKVLDFGLVKDIDADERASQADDATQAGELVGSPKYMSPEQIRGDRVDARTDIYSLGVVLYEIVTGKVPFDKGSTIATLMGHMNEPVPPIGQANPLAAISPGFEQLVMKCLAKSADERFSSIDEVLGALKRLGDPAQAALTMTGELASTSSGPHSASGALTGPHVFVAGSSGPSSMQPSAPAPSGPPAPARARWPLFAAVGAAAALALGLFVKTQLSHPPPPSVASSPAAQPAAQAAAQAGAARADGPKAEPTTAPAEAKSAEAPKPAQVSFEARSEPSGATVRLGDKGGKELCSSTPCQITLEGDEAKAGAELKLYFSKSGFSASTETYKVGDSSASAKLAKEKSGGGAARGNQNGQGAGYRVDPYAAPPYLNAPPTEVGGSFHEEAETKKPGWSAGLVFSRVAELVS